MKEKIKLGYIGLGRRGSYVLRKCFAMMKDVYVKYICDLSEENLKKAEEKLQKAQEELEAKKQQLEEAKKELDAYLAAQTGAPAENEEAEDLA